VFDRLKEIRLKAGRLEQHMSLLLQGAQQDAAMGTRVQAPGAPPAPSAPMPPPPKVSSAPRPMGTTPDYHYHHGFQNPAPPDAPKLPPPRPQQDPRAALSTILGHIDDLRATAIHLHNAANLLLAISNLLEQVITRQIHKTPRY
jgi:hypothetical protein